MIKKSLLFFVSVFTFISCEDDISNPKATFKLDEDLHQELLNQYSFDEINVKVYENENNWINVCNSRIVRNYSSKTNLFVFIIKSKI